MDSYNDENYHLTQYKIVVPTEEDKQDLIEAFKHIHDSDINTEHVPVNQLAHEYQNFNNIIVDPDLYQKLKFVSQPNIDMIE